MAVPEAAFPNNNKPEERQGREWPAWHSGLLNYRKPSVRKASWQLINKFLPYFYLWFLMIRSIQLGYPYLLMLILVVIAAAFLVRLFIRFHDCVHG